MGAEFDVSPLLQHFGRMTLGGDDVEMAAVGGPGGSSGPGVVDEATGSVAANLSENRPPPGQGGDVSANRRVDHVPFLFDPAPATEKCKAIKWEPDPAKCVLVQCGGDRVRGGDFCRAHGRKQAHGIWEPPGHETVPLGKLEKAKKEAAQRAAKAQAAAKIEA